MDEKTKVWLASLGIRARRTQGSKLLHEYGYCTDCGHINDRGHYKKTCSKCLRDARKYYQANKKERCAKLRAWNKAHPEETKASTKASAVRLKKDVLNAYGKVCQCCGEDNFMFLCIDHVNGDGLKHRKLLQRPGSGAFYSYLRKNNYPTEPPLQVLCYNCNQGRQLNKGICPHKELS